MAIIYLHKVYIHAQRLAVLPTSEKQLFALGGGIAVKVMRHRLLKTQLKAEPLCHSCQGSGTIPEEGEEERQSHRNGNSVGKHCLPGVITSTVADSQHSLWSREALLFLKIYSQLMVAGEERHVPFSHVTPGTLSILM